MVDLKTATFERDNKVWAVGFVYVDGGFGDRVPEYVQRLLIAETLLKDAGFCGARIVAYPSWEKPYHLGEIERDPIPDLKLDSTMIWVASAEREATPEEVAQHTLKKVGILLGQLRSYQTQLEVAKAFIEGAREELEETLRENPSVADGLYDSQKEILRGIIVEEKS